jgi:hypothetical protein
MQTSSAKYGATFTHTVTEEGFSEVKSKLKVKAHTTCTLYKRNASNRWEQIAEGMSTFNADKDYFSFYQGRKHALASAVKLLTVPKKTKAEMWKSFLDIVGYGEDTGVFFIEE